MFKGLEDEADEDLEISQMVEEYTNQGGTILGELIRTVGNLTWVLQKMPHIAFVSFSRLRVASMGGKTKIPLTILKYNARLCIFKSSNEPLHFSQYCNLAYNPG